MCKCIVWRGDGEVGCGWEWIVRGVRGGYSD